jgi:Fe-S-cluster containining protein
MIDPKTLRFPVVNLTTAKFDCTFGRGCDGVCCRHGEPPVYPDEAARLEASIEHLMPSLRPAAQDVIRRDGLLDRSQDKAGQPTLRVADGWCVFFNAGCVLHRIGEAEGDKYKYKPVICSLFPLTKDTRGEDWKVRQKGFDGEQWDLPCLDPDVSLIPATVSLEIEVALAQKVSAEDAEKGVS